jgi:hypothetical protein
MTLFAMLIACYKKSLLRIGGRLANKDHAPSIVLIVKTKIRPLSLGKLFKNYVNIYVSHAKNYFRKLAENIAT